jgi:hypothetical protein
LNNPYVEVGYLEFLLQNTVRNFFQQKLRGTGDFQTVYGEHIFYADNGKTLEYLGQCPTVLEVKHMNSQVNMFSLLCAHFIFFIVITHNEMS